MAEETLIRVLEDIKTLGDDELRTVQHELQNRLAGASAEEAEQRFLQATVEAGLIVEIKTPDRGHKRERPLARVNGKPLSETIIDERR